MSVPNDFVRTLFCIFVVLFLFTLLTGEVHNQYAQPVVLDAGTNYLTDYSIPQPSSNSIGKEVGEEPIVIPCKDNSLEDCSYARTDNG